MIRLATGACLALILAAAAVAEPPLVPFAFEQWRATPELRIEDAYKWLYQATLGAEHAVPEPDAARAWLAREWSSLEPTGGSEAETVPLTPDGRLVRVHLRPYKTRGGDPEALLEAFVRSASRFSGEKTELVSAWEALGRRLENGPWHHLSAEEWRRLDRRVRSDGFPALRHSEAYRQRYQPAYRVVLTD